jgi:hypothetical protein
MKPELPYDSLDDGIREYVRTLATAGVDTFESCQGGEGRHALAIAQSFGLGILELRRVWPINDGEPTGPWWEITFRTTSR